MLCCFNLDCNLRHIKYIFTSPTVLLALPEQRNRPLTLQGVKAIAWRLCKAQKEYTSYRFCLAKTACALSNVTSFAAGVANQNFPGTEGNRKVHSQEGQPAHCSAIHSNAIPRVRHSQSTTLTCILSSCLASCIQLQPCQRTSARKNAKNGKVWMYI